jgi:UDP-GlcNAc:undecaprenyl-phosphate GlcNAc-1-phosphate transferase
MAVVRRTLAGRSPFSPDRKHLHHRMLALGHSHRWAVALMHAWVALLSFGAAATAFWPWATVVRVGGVAGVLLLLLTVVPRVLEMARTRSPAGPPAPSAPGGGRTTVTLPEPGPAPRTEAHDARDPVPVTGGPARREDT